MPQTENLTYREKRLVDAVSRIRNSETPLDILVNWDRFTDLLDEDIKNFKK